MTPEQKKLNIGCGFRKLEDHWNVDRDPNCNPNQVVDLEQFPWPYEDDFFERVTALNVLNHLGRDPEDFAKILQEMYRVSANGAEWHIRSVHPYNDMAVDDFYQRRTLTPKTFIMMDQKYNFESLAKKTGESTYGFGLNIDLEIKEITPILMPYYQQQLQSGMLGEAQLEIYASSRLNVVESFTVFMKVHKPQRFADWYQDQSRK